MAARKGKRSRKRLDGSAPQPKRQSKRSPAPQRSGSRAASGREGGALRRRPWAPSRLALLLAVLSFGVYCANCRPSAISDPLPTSLIPVTLLTHGDFFMDTYEDYFNRHAITPYFFMPSRHGRFLPTYPVATGLAVTPLYALPVLLYARTQPDPGDWLHFAAIAGKIAAALITAGSVAVFYLLALRLGAGRRWGVALALAFAFATEAWSTNSQALWQHGLGVLAMLVASLLALREVETPSLMTELAFGTTSAFTVAVRPTNLVFALPLFAWVVLRRSPQFMRRALACGAGPLLIGVALVIYNLRSFGRLSGGYLWQGTAAFGGAVAGLLVSPGRGLFVYFPLALLGVVGVVQALRHRQFWTTIAAPWTLFMIAHLLLVASFYSWWGGYSFGPRLLSEIQPILLLLAIPLFTSAASERSGSVAPESSLPPRGRLRSRLLVFAFALLFTWSAALQAVGAFLDGVGWNASPVPVDVAQERLWDWFDNPIGRVMSLGGVMRLLYPPEPLHEWRASYRLPTRLDLRPGESTYVPVVVTNRSDEVWPDYGDDHGQGRVALSYHILNAAGKRVIDEGIRTPLGRLGRPGLSWTVIARLDAPSTPGRYVVEFTLVQEGVDWFDSKAVGPGRLDLWVRQ
jgi:hypothetical protein